MTEKDKEVYTKLKTMIIEKELEDFWVMCDNKTFSPIKNMSTTNMTKMLKEKASIYGGRKIASVSLTPKHNKTYDSDFMVHISIYQIDTDGTINKKPFSTWGLKYHYKIEDMNAMKFSMSQLHKIIHLCSTKKLINDTSDGYNVKVLLNKLQEKKIDLSIYEISL